MDAEAVHQVRQQTSRDSACGLTRKLVLWKILGHRNQLPSTSFHGSMHRLDAAGGRPAPSSGFLARRGANAKTDRKPYQANLKNVSSLSPLKVSEGLSIPFKTVWHSGRFSLGGKKQANRPGRPPSTL